MYLAIQSRKCVFSIRLFWWIARQRDRRSFLVQAQGPIQCFWSVVPQSDLLHLVWSYCLTPLWNHIGFHLMSQTRQRRRDSGIVVPLVGIYQYSAHIRGFSTDPVGGGCMVLFNLNRGVQTPIAAYTMS